MRITKKFAGASCIGKQVFQANDDFLEEEVAECEEELRVLEESFLTRLLGKEAKSSPGGAATSVQGRSSGRDRSKNSSTIMNHSDDYYMDDEYGGELDDEVDPSVRGDAKAILGSTSAWLLSSKNTESGGSISRVMSAPALLDLDVSRNKQNAFRALSSAQKGRGNNFLGRAGKSPSAQSRRMKSGGRRTSLKRTMSVMALDERDLFYGDDKAASDLLLQFVTKVKQDAQPRLHSGSPSHDYSSSGSGSGSSSSSSSSSSDGHVGKVIKTEKYDEGARTLSPFGGDTGGSSPQNISGSNGDNSSDNSSSGITTIDAANEADDDMHMQPHSLKGKGDIGGFMRMPPDEESKSPVGLDMDE